MKTKKTLVALLTALSLAACHRHRSTTYVNNQPGSPNNPGNPGGGGGNGSSTVQFSTIPDQQVNEGGSIQLDLDNYATNSRGEPILLEVSRGPGEVDNTWSSRTNVDNSYFHDNAVDPDFVDNSYVVEITATNWPGEPAFGPFTTTFNLIQRDNNPRRLATRQQQLSSGLEATVLDTTSGVTNQHQQNQTGIAVDPTTGPHVIYRGPEWKSTLAHQENGTWIARPFGNFEGDYVSFNFDQGVGHLTFDAGSGGEGLAYTTFSGTDWQPRTIVNNGLSVGLENDMNRDAQGKLHISHFGWYDDTINYSTNLAGGWVNESNLASARWDQTSIATDANGNPHIAYVRPDGRIGHLYNNGTAWQNVALQIGTNPVIRRGNQNNLHLLFNDGRLRHGTATPGGPWNVDTILSANHSAPQKLDMEFRSADDSIHIAHVNNALFYTTNIGGSWRTFTVDNSAVHSSPDLALSGGRVYMSSIRNGNEAGYVSFNHQFFTN